jgi:hypothetical protein
MNPSTLLLLVNVIHALSLGVQMAPSVRRDLAVIIGGLQRLVTSGEVPLEEDWRELNRRLGSASQKLQDARDMLEQG